MGGGHSDPAPVQTCGASINISGGTVDLGNAQTQGSGCTQHTSSSATGAHVGVTVSPTITLPSAKEDALMNLLAAKGITSIDHLKQIVKAKVATATNQGVVVANNTNSNPGVVIANQSQLWSQQPGVKFYNDTFENAGAKYYEAVLQNPGVRMYMNQHPGYVADAMAAEKTNTVEAYRQVFENPGFDYYIQQHADQLGSLALGTPYMI